MGITPGRIWIYQMCFKTGARDRVPVRACLLFDKTTVHKELQQFLGDSLVLLHDLLKIITDTRRYDCDISF